MGLESAKKLIKTIKEAKKEGLVTLEASEIEKQDFIDTVKVGLSEINEEKIMTLAEQFKQEGVEIGLQQGLQQGLQEGMEKGKQEGKAEAFETMVMKLFGQGMTIAQVAAVTGLSVFDVERLKNKQAN